MGDSPTKTSLPSCAVDCQKIRNIHWAGIGCRSVSMLPLHPLDSSWFVETHLLPRSIAFQIASCTRRFASSFLVPRLVSNPKKMLECLSVRQLLALVANCWRTPVLYARRIEKLYLISQWFPKPWVAPSAPSSWWKICLSRSISHHHIAFLTVGRHDGLIQFCPYGEVRQAWYFARYGAKSSSSQFLSHGHKSTLLLCIHTSRKGC